MCGREGTPRHPRLVRRLVGTRSRAIRGSTSDDRVGCSASDGRCAPARPALQGVACLDASFAVSATRARECRLYSALSIIAPSVNVLRRTRRKPSTIRGAAPDVVIGQSTAARTGARPYLRFSLLRMLKSALASCERAAPDAPETIDDQRRCTGCRCRTIYGGSRGSAFPTT